MEECISAPAQTTVTLLVVSWRAAASPRAHLNAGLHVARQMIGVARTLNAVLQKGMPVFNGQMSDQHGMIGEAVV